MKAIGITLLVLTLVSASGTWAQDEPKSAVEATAKSPVATPVLSFGLAELVQDDAKFAAEPAGAAAKNAPAENPPQVAVIGLHAEIPAPISFLSGDQPNGSWARTLDIAPHLQKNRIIRIQCGQSQFLLPLVSDISAEDFLRKMIKFSERHPKTRFATGDRSFWILPEQGSEVDTVVYAFSTLFSSQQILERQSTKKDQTDDRRQAWLKTATPISSEADVLIPELKRSTKIVISLGEYNAIMPLPSEVPMEAWARMIRHFAKYHPKQTEKSFANMIGTAAGHQPLHAIRLFQLDRSLVIDTSLEVGVELLQAMAKELIHKEQSPFNATLLFVDSDWSRSPKKQEIEQDLKMAFHNVPLMEGQKDRLLKAAPQILFAQNDQVSYYTPDNAAALLKWLIKHQLVQRFSSGKPATIPAKPVGSAEQQAKAPKVRTGLAITDNSLINSKTEVQQNLGPFVSMERQHTWFVEDGLVETGKIAFTWSVSNRLMRRGQPERLNTESSTTLSFPFPENYVVFSNAFGSGIHEDQKEAARRRVIPVLVLFRDLGISAASAAVNLPDKVDLVSAYNSPNFRGEISMEIEWIPRRTLPGLEDPIRIWHLAPVADEVAEDSKPQPAAKPASVVLTDEEQLEQNRKTEEKIKAAMKGKSPDPATLAENKQREEIAKEYEKARKEIRRKDELLERLAAERFQHIKKLEQQIEELEQYKRQVTEAREKKTDQEAKQQGDPLSLEVAESWEKGQRVLGLNILSQSGATDQINVYRRRYDTADKKAKEIAADVRGNPDKPAEVQEALVRSVTNAFEARQQLHRTELAALKQRLEQLQQSIQKREAKRTEIINRRVENLLNPDLNWDAAKTNPSESS